MSDDHEVGYGKPPRHTRFRQGQSGNPRGRPKGAKDLMTELTEELQEKILVREGRTQKQVSKQRAMLKSLTAKAVQGDTKAATLLVGMVYRLFHGDEPAQPETDLSAEDLSILETFRSRSMRAPQHEDPDEASPSASEPGDDQASDA